MHQASRLIFLILFGLFASSADAHFNMLLPQPASTKRGEPVTFLYQWGHPFEHQLFDAPAPAGLSVLAPDGKKTDLVKTLEKTTVPGTDGKKVIAYRFRLTPEQRGDYLLVLTTPPIWMEEEKEFYQDTVKVVLHVQAQKGWDASGPAWELVPLTRPYGLQPGMVFQAQLLNASKPAAGSLVEIERYNAVTPKELPPDEQITHVVKTDPSGVVTCTLTDPGWWCLTAQRDGGQRDYKGTSYPVRQRTTLWVFVGAQRPAKPSRE